MHCSADSIRGLAAPYLFPSVGRAGRVPRPDFWRRMSEREFDAISEDDYGKLARGRLRTGEYFAGNLYSAHEGGSATIKRWDGAMLTFEREDWNMLPDPSQPDKVRG